MRFMGEMRRGMGGLLVDNVCDSGDLGFEAKRRCVGFGLVLNLFDRPFFDPEVMHLGWILSLCMKARMGSIDNVTWYDCGSQWREWLMCLLLFWFGWFGWLDLLQVHGVHRSRADLVRRHVGTQEAILGFCRHPRGGLACAVGAVCFATIMA